MKKVREDSGHLISQAVRETLDSVVTPSVRDALLKNALDVSRQAEVPRDPELFRDFVGGPLRDVLVKALGSELGETVALELERLADVASSRSPGEPARPSEGRRTRSGQLRAPSSPPKRRTTPPPRAAWPPSVASQKKTLESPTPRRVVAQSPPSLRPPPHDAKTPQAAPPPVSSREAGMLPYQPTIPAGRKPLSSQIPRPPSSDEFPRGTAATLGIAGASPESDAKRSAGGRQRRLPFVLVATREASLARKISQWVDPRAVVMRTRGLVPLLHDLEDAGEARVVLVVDCSAPSIRPIALAAVAEELPENLQIVLWSATPEIEREIALISPLTREWLIYVGPASAKDLAARCVELVG